MQETFEKQYMPCLEIDEKFGRSEFGIMSNFVWQTDPKRLVFLLSRYKFVSKMLTGCRNALEIGCADAFGTRIVRQAVPEVVATDIDPIFIEDCIRREQKSTWPISYRIHDILSAPVPGSFDGVYSCDVFEHIHPKDEKRFILNIRDSMSQNGIAVIGCPSLESQVYASAGSKAGHVNCKSGEDLQNLWKHYFHTVLLFSMNDEVVHTGFSKLAHYLFIVCTGKKA
ncbi:MAG: class I SAM-dependent methyltransferase [Chlamydiia bacterium]|nr:class I SAM-dependent methyltransferase [Chlamydiia bacterium]